MVEHVAAMIAGMLAGAMPMIVWSGTFDENRLVEGPSRVKSLAIEHAARESE